MVERPGTATSVPSLGESHHAIQAVPLAQLRDTLITALEQSVIADNKADRMMGALQALASLASEAGDDACVYIADYKFGDIIVERGQFRLPPACDCMTCGKARNSLGQHVPLMLVVEGAAEVFVEPRDLMHGGDSPMRGRTRTAPLRMVRVGEWLGVFEVLDRLHSLDSEPGPWSVSAGPRTMALLLNFRGTTPSRLFNFHDRTVSPRDDPWPLFRHLLRENLSTSWTLRLMLIPDDLVRTAHAERLLLRVHEIAWVQSAHFRAPADDRLEDDLRSAGLSDALAKKLQSTAQANILHLHRLATGLLPALVPTTSRCDQQDGPFGELLTYLTQVENGRRRVRSTYTPVILQPDSLATPGAVGFYSFRRPSLPIAITQPPDKEFATYFSETVDKPVRAVYSADERRMNSGSGRDLFRHARSLRFYRHAGDDSAKERRTAVIDNRLIYPASAIDATEFGVTGEGVLFTGHSWFTGMVRIERD